MLLLPIKKAALSGGFLDLKQEVLAGSASTIGTAVTIGTGTVRIAAFLVFCIKYFCEHFYKCFHNE